MNQQQLLLTQLLGSKELTFGTLIRNFRWIWKFVAYHHPFGLESYYTMEMNGVEYDVGLGSGVEIPSVSIIWHPATETDFKRWLIGKGFDFTQWEDYIFIMKSKLLDNGMFADFISELSNNAIRIKYDSSKDLLEQSPEALAQIIELIRNNQ